MNDTDARHDCPAMPALVEWFDGTLDHGAADRIEGHLTDCGRCRRSLLDWSERAGVGIGSAAPTPECPDAEILVAYRAAALDASAAADVERHLQQCARCVPALQHIIMLQRQMQPEPVAETIATEAVFGRAVAPSPVTLPLWKRGMKGDLSSWWQWLRESLTSTAWPRAALAAAAVLVLAVGITRFIQPSNQLQEMHGRSGEHAAMVEMTADTDGHARPALDEPVVVRVARGTQARWLEASGEWTRIELADGRRVWVETTMVIQVHNE
jgi:anti-sigma factor RsiW